MGGLAAVGEQQYSLRWNDFHSSILSSFRHLRDEEDFVDVTLACDGRSFSAHKVVLSACSPYFRRLLKANPCTHPIVILRDVREQDMAALLRFMYNGEVHVGHDQLPDFLKTAQTLQVRGLADVPNKESKLPPALTDSLAWPAASDEQSSREDANQSPPPKRSRTEHKERDSSREHRDRERERERDRDRDQETDRERDRSQGGTPKLNDISNAEQHSLLGQALESGVPAGKKQSDSPAHALSTHSTGEDDEDSNSGSDTGMSDRGDMVLPKAEPAEYSMDDNNGPHGNGSLSIDPHRSSNFPAALLGLQGLPGLLPGPSGLHGGQDTNFVSRRSIDLMRVRATDPRPCPKCGKIYRSAHTLRTHLEDKHTICPGYRCVLCGTVAKSRNSLHSHMSRQHRGISTKDLPVLPMPSPFDPELASRLLAKAGVKVSPAELRARSSPTGPPRRSDIRLDLKMDSGMRYSGGGVVGNRDPSEAGSTGGMNAEDPEDLTLPISRSPPEVFSRVSSGGAPGPTSPSPLHGPVMAAKSAEAASAGSRRGGAPEPLSAPPIGGGGGGTAPAGPNASTGSPILDTYLQLIAESQSNNLHLTLSDRAKLAAEMQRRRNNNDFSIHPAALGLAMGQGHLPGHGHGQGGLTIRAHPANDLDNDVDADAASTDGEGDPDHDGQGDTGAEYSEEEPEPITAE